MHERARVALGIVGVFATLLGVLAVASPSVVTETEPLVTLVGVASSLEPRTLFVFGSAAIGLYAVTSAWRSPDDRLVGGDRDGVARFDRVRTDPPETVTAPGRTLAGSDFDAAVERAAAGDERALDQVRDRLHGLAVARLVHDGRAPESATEVVASGEWTDDRTAAAFLSADAGPVYSLGSRLRLWLDPATERQRRVHRTVAAIEAAPDATLDGSERSESDGADGESGTSDAAPAESGESLESDDRAARGASGDGRSVRGESGDGAQTRGGGVGE